MPTAEHPCPRCGARTITGQTMRPSLEVTLDPGPLDPIGELTAVLEGRATCTLHAVAGQLAYRGARQIGTRPAGSRPRELVLREHRCEKGA